MDKKQEKIVNRIFFDDKKNKVTTKLYQKLLLLLIVVLYSFVALYNLGSTKVPETFTKVDNSVDVSVVDFGEAKEVSEIWYYSGIGEGEITFSFSNDGETFIEQTITQQISNAEMYRWLKIEQSFSAQYVKIAFDLTDVYSNSITMEEICFVDSNNKTVSAKSINNLEEYDGNKMFDEQYLRPDEPSYMTGMYFDEVYHARTAYEHLEGLEPYENTHPPLGKVFISAGISTFGMNPFGWRIVGTIFGIGMLPIMFYLALRITKKTFFAFCATLLLAFDCMHFGQTRIATIDTYAVFFIMLMYLFMFKYYEMSFYKTSFRKTLVPLALSGLFFGLGAASKWTCIYAGGGLCVLFFYTMYKRYKEYKFAKLNIDSPDFTDEQREHLLHITNTFKKYFTKTIFWCVLIFIIVPLGIYYLSYIPYMLCKEQSYGFKEIMDTQSYMLNYHGGLETRHPFESPWWQWPLLLRPTWYYIADTANNIVSSISAFGNPIVWWGCFVGTIGLVVTMFSRKIKDIEPQKFIIIGFLAQFVPWIFITRATFVYHYFTSIPFIILATVYFFKILTEKNKKFKIILIVFIVIAFIGFVAFYPMVSGMPVPRWYAEMIKWFPTWNFFN